MAGIFKAYDVRGLYPEQLNEDIARAVGQAFPAVLDDEVLERNRSVVVSRDMRPHSRPLQEALIDGYFKDVKPFAFSVKADDAGILIEAKGELKGKNMLSRMPKGPVMRLAQYSSSVSCETVSTTQPSTMKSRSP